METARLFSQRSTCLRKQVGAVLVKDGRVISTGYNGVPAGMIHCEKYFENWYAAHREDLGFKNFDEFVQSQRFYDLHHSEYSYFENHAEVNCISYAARSGVAVEGSEIYSTTFPCLDCSKLIVASGIISVCYLEEYDRDNRGIDFLKSNKIKINKI